MGVWGGTARKRRLGGGGAGGDTGLSWWSMLIQE